jgi:hypothetical protein
MIDSVVAQATDSVFCSFGVSVLPLTPLIPSENVTSSQHLSGTIAFRSSKMTGWLTLSLPQAVCEPILEKSAQPFPLDDLTRELTNQIMGGIKSRLMRYDVVLRFGLPMAGPGVRPQPRTRRNVVVYPFKTDRGEFTVALDGTIDQAALVFNDALTTTSEGTITLF